MTTGAQNIGDLIEGATKYLKEPALSFFASQLRNSSQRVKARGRRWSYRDKVIALSLYHQGPRAYQFCCRLFTLPSISSLQKWLQSVEIHPGFSDTILNVMKHKVSTMNDRDKLCVITFDEMSLRTGLSYDISSDSIEGFEDYGMLGRTSRVANHALVFMVRGMLSHWKQPIGYFLSRDATPANRLGELLKECVNKVKDIGLIPKLVVCDQGSNNVKMYKDLSITEEKTHLIFDDNKVYFMFDPPHLLKNTRTNLCNYLFKFEDDGAAETVRWSYIRKFYDYDSQLPIRMAPKLSKGHFDLDSFSKMRVRKAAQVLSYTVAAGIYTYTSMEKLPAEAAYTAEFIEKIDKLFDAFNCRCFKEKKVLKRPVSKSSGHVSFLNSCVPWLKSLQIVGAKNVLCIKGWILNIACLLKLWEEMKLRDDIKFLLTGRFNQDVVENMFSTIRRKGGWRDNPAASEFRFAYRMVMVAELIKPALSSNCAHDTDQFMLTLSSLSQKKGSKHNKCGAFATSAGNSMHIPVTESALNLLEQNTMAYIAGYLSNKILTGHEVLAKCDKCGSALLSSDTVLDNPALLFTHNKAWDTKSSEFGSLKIPSDSFLEFCTVCEQVFRAEFNDMGMTRSRISYLIKDKISQQKEYEALKVCSDKIKIRILAVFVSMRIHYALKYKNRDLKDITVKRKDKKAKKVMHK